MNENKNKKEEIGYSIIYSPMWRWGMNYPESTQIDWDDMKRNLTIGCT